MGLLAWLMYRSLAGKERRRARRAALRGRQEEREPAVDGLGARGERLAYWYVRQAGYTVVARNWRARSGVGELDLVGWDGRVLAFVEVKARASGATGPPELAVSREKQARIIKAAGEYLRQFKGKPVNYRFDVVSVFVNSAQDVEVRLIRNAFSGLLTPARYRRA